MSILEHEAGKKKDIPVPIEDKTFVNSTHARPLRILGEYLHLNEVFLKEGVTDTVVFFGSARIPPPPELQNDPTAPNTKTDHSGLSKLSQFYVDAMKLSEEITKWSILQHDQTGRSVLVCTGGGPGIMEAANRGADNVNGKSIGLNIVLPREQHPNPYITKKLNFNFQYFFMRKYWFMYFAKVLVVFPGGYGTMDELFETLTLKQTGIVNKDVKILLYGKDFWENMVQFKTLAKYGLITPADLDLFQIVDSVPQALAECINILGKKMQE